MNLQITNIKLSVIVFSSIKILKLRRMNGRSSFQSTLHFWIRTLQLRNTFPPANRNQVEKNCTRVAELLVLLLSQTTAKLATRPSQTLLGLTSRPAKTRPQTHTRPCRPVPLIHASADRLTARRARQETSHNAREQQDAVACGPSLAG